MGRGSFPDRRRLHGVVPLLAVLCAAAAGCRSSGPPLETVPDLDLDRYLGRWYEIASIPQSFQQGCVATTADYSLRDDGRMRVENTCREESFDGDLRSATGVAWRPHPEAEPGRLRVQFFWPFWGRYWVIELDPSYRFAVVGHPSRDYLWVLSRTPEMDPVLYGELLERIRAHGYDTSRLQWTPQPPGPPGTDSARSAFPVRGPAPAQLRDEAPQRAHAANAPTRAEGQDG